jgi:hypothetical protein
VPPDRLPFSPLLRTNGCHGTLLSLMAGVTLLMVAMPGRAYVDLMAGQRARPLNGTFNRVPVLHSNQPEEVEGPGILINTAPGTAWAAENGQPLRNAEFTFQGEFGMHLHHKYFPPYRASIRASERRTELTLAAILINPGYRPVHIRFENGAVRNSFEAPYLANNLMGVKPLGPRPWNTGPGDATAVQMLRGKLDNRLVDEITIPPRSRIVLFQTPLPALGIANALLRGKSDGPFHIAVVAARNPTSDSDLIAVLDSARLAPGRTYLNQLREIEARQVFSRVGGVALGDTYAASIRHDLTREGALHVPFTSTPRHHFGTRDVQVNPLAVRMLDSAVDNIGTYGVRFNVDLQLQGDGSYELVMSHPARAGGQPFTAFRGSLQIVSPEGLREVHVGLRSGQSLSLSSLVLQPGRPQTVRVSMVYPADATPGHLLSVVPTAQFAMVQQRERQLEIARREAQRTAPPAVPPAPAGATPAAMMQRPLPAAPPLLPAPAYAPLRLTMPSMPVPPPLVPGGLVPPPPSAGQVDRYRQAVDAQQRELQRWQDR